MALRVFRGHFEALEASFLDFTAALAGRGRLAVVTSGRAQLERLQELLLGERREPLAGIEFFPGFPHLARKLAPVTAAGMSKPSCLDMVFMMMEAARMLDAGMPFSDVAENPRSALSLAGFVEGLLEKGVDPEAYSTVLMTLEREPSPTELSLEAILRGYGRFRRELYPTTPDSLIASAISSRRFDRYAAYLFYGIYDMNPLQRRLASRLVSTAGTEIGWFTPLTPKSASGLDIAARTIGLLDRGIQMPRADSAIRQGPFATFGENLVSDRIGRVPERGFEYLLVHGSSGTARAVLREVEAARLRGTPLSRIAVIGRKSLTAPVARQARGEGIPLYRTPEVSLSALPAGAMAKAAIEAVEHECHHMYLRRIPATGALRDGCSPDTDEIDQAILGTGVRTGVEAMRSAAEAAPVSPRFQELLGHLESLERLLGEKAVPTSDLPRILGSLRSMADEAPGRVLGAGADALGTLWDAPVPRRAFTQALVLALDNTPSRIGASEDSGLRILDFEDARGLQFELTLIVGLEEGVIPSSGFDDPRLSAELREGLEIPSASVREKEEAFLLALACGTASERLVFVQRLTDDKGEVVQHSPLVDPLLDECGEERARFFLPVAPAPGECRMGPPPWLRRQKTDALWILFGGTDPGQRAVMEAAGGGVPPFLPFLREAIHADEERRHADRLGAFDGLVGADVSSLVHTGGFSPTFLGAWGGCPFRCLAEKGWKLRAPAEVGVTISPDPLSRGNLLHSVIERVLLEIGLDATEDDVRRVIGSHRESGALPARLGSVALSEAFVGDTTGLVLSFLGLLRRYGTRAVRAEEGLSVEAGGLSFSGRADLLLEAASGLYVVDIKTGRTVPTDRELQASILAGSEYQIPLYCAALEQRGHRVAGAGYFYCAPIPSARTFEGERLAEAVSAALRNAPRAAALAREGMYFPLPGKGCERCRWSALCRRSDYFTGRVERILVADEVLGWMRPEKDGGKGGDG